MSKTKTAVIQGRSVVVTVSSHDRTLKSRVHCCLPLQTGGAKDSHFQIRHIVALSKCTKVFIITTDEQ